MMKTTLKSKMLGTALLAAVVASFGLSTTAHSMTLNLAQAKLQVAHATSQLPVETIAHKGGGYGGYRHGGGSRWYRHGGGGYYGYNRGRHGPRYGYRYGNYRHYYGGYWYAYPWWLGAAAVTAPYYGRPSYGGGAHVEWCLNRYRSYNPRTDTYRGYDGYDHRCISPYM